MGKQHICIVLEDKKNNIFGGYLHNEIVGNKWINDKNSFLFSIKRNNKQLLLKYKKKRQCNSFFLSYDDDDVLFQFGGDNSFSSLSDIQVGLTNQKVLYGSCQSNLFNYHGFSNPFVDTPFFEIKRLIIYELF